MAATAIGVMAYGAALVLTLAACAHLTPRAWWRRPNARAIGVVGAGTLLGGALLLALFGAAATTATSATPAAAGKALPAAAGVAGMHGMRGSDGGGDPPVAGAGYRVREALNLRVAGGVGAARVLVVPAGSRVVATGRRDGDWWQVRASVGGAPVEGWASSLWLRRADEGAHGASASSRIGL